MCPVGGDRGSSIVIKVSKLCNLRCVYCYETPWLANAARMSIEEVATIFSTVKTLLVSVPVKARKVVFYWQGGEPFVQPIEYWRRIIDMQREILPLDQFEVCNEIQSNGTLITLQHLSLLRRDYLLGLSFDVANELRLTASGCTTAGKVTSALDWLLAERVPLSGCIAVISRNNIGRPYEVADYFLYRNLDFRLLNVYTALDALPQVREQAVDWLEYLRFCEKLLHYASARRALDTGVSIEPLSTALTMLHTHLKANKQSERNDGEREWVLVVDTNGDVYLPAICTIMPSGTATYSETR